MNWLSWDLFIAIAWAVLAFSIWLDPRDRMPKNLTILLMVLLAIEHFFDALEKAYS